MLKPAPPPASPTSGMRYVPIIGDVRDGVVRLRPGGREALEGRLRK